MTKQTIDEFQRDAISASDQRLIDEYITKNGVTRCAYGERAIEPSYTWNGNTLVPDHQGISWRNQIKHNLDALKKAAKHRPNAVAARIRRGKVLELAHKGWTSRDIAEHLNASTHLICVDARRLGVKLRPHNVSLEDWKAQQ